MDELDEPDFDEAYVLVADQRRVSRNVRFRKSFLNFRNFGSISYFLILCFHDKVENGECFKITYDQLLNTERLPKFLLKVSVTQKRDIIRLKND